MTNALQQFTPDWISPPGETIMDILEEKGWTQAEFALRIGFSAKHVNQLLKSKTTLTEETAILLERVLGSSASFWLNREALYRESLARKKSIVELRKDVEWTKQLPLKDMITFGYIKKHEDKALQTIECLKFFGVATVDAWIKRYSNQEFNAAFRASDKFEKNTGAVTAWLRKGELEAEKITCAPFDAKTFQHSLRELRKLTKETDPKVFVPKMVEICRRAGVAVVFSPAPKGCPASGATRWLSDKALLMLSLRHKTNDQLWFSFFHEAAHLLLHGKKMTFIETDGLSSEREEEANVFSGNLLIPPQFTSRLQFLGRSPANVKEFAKKLDIAPGIVVGRLQNEGLIPWNLLNKLKVRYCWNHEK